MLSFLGECLRFAFCFAVTLYFLLMVIQAARTGRVYHSDSSSHYDFRRQPVRFLFVCLVFLGFAAVMGYCAALAFRDAWSAWLHWVRPGV